MGWLGPDAFAVVRPTRACLLDFFFLHSSVFYVLLDPCLCFVSFLCLDLYVLGWIGWRSFMQTKHICVLIHILTKGEVGAVELVGALQKKQFY